jgi:hypothetical protein
MAFGLSITVLLLLLLLLLRLAAGDWRTNSNCYCYALNVYKGGFCIPGATNILSSGSASPSVTPSCDVIRAAALAGVDGFAVCFVPGMYR